MRLAPATLGHRQATGETGLSAGSALLLAAWFGLVGGYLDLGIILLRKDVLHLSVYYHQGRDFPWLVPLGNLAILMVPGSLVAAVNRLRAGTIPLRAAAWLFATLALWGPLLRMPLHAAASLVLAVGLGRWIGRTIAGRAPRLPRFSLAGLVVLLAVLAAASTGRGIWAERRAVAGLPTPPSGAGNVLLIVLDTVRAESLSLYGYSRATTPNLERWAKRGVRFDLALSPAPWTFPSHASFFTGQWPYKLKAHWQLALDAAYPTLAEYLASRGYQTAGFAANTSYCSRETGLDRGFAHYEDYPLTPRAILGCTAPGRWLLRHAVMPGDFYNSKWIEYQSRPAPEINRAFLGWLARRRPDRPFFAFLNYLDAHEPFVLPEGQGAHFGLRPESPADRRMLRDYWDLDKTKLGPREVTLARDSYDDCIAYLDRQVGALLDELDRRGVLRDTLVIVTSDHGEEFGEHGVFNHGYSLYLREVRVPLLIVSPTATPPGLVVPEPVSLRDLPATVVDLLGLAAGSPFPGRSLASRWRSSPGPPTSPALSEAAIPVVLAPQRGPGPTQRGYSMSLVDGGRHYILDGAGREELYDLANDPRERLRDEGSPDGPSDLGHFRWSLLRILDGDPPRISPTGGRATRRDPIAIEADRSLVRYRVLLESLARGRPAWPIEAGGPRR